MPEATMDENRFSRRRKDDVGRAWQVTTMETKSAAHRVQQSPNHNLGLRVAWTDTRHESGAIR